MLAISPGRRSASLGASRCRADAPAPQSEGEGDSHPLVDRAQRVELGSDVGAADEVRAQAERYELVVQRTHRLLAGADDDVIDGEEAGRAVVPDVQARV